MTGIYPDVPAKRIEYDIDGSAGFSWDNATLTVLSQANLQTLNDEASGSLGWSANASGKYYGVVFSAPQTLEALYLSGAGTITIQYSLDTTNGQDGTWTDVPSGPPVSSSVETTWRTITTITPINGVKGIRAISGSLGSQSLRAIHAYGHRTNSGDVLGMWHPTLSQMLYLTPALGDFGDRLRNSGYAEMSFRVKNLSTTLIADNVSISSDALTDSSPTSTVSQIEFRYNGGSWGSTASVGDLNPEEVSQVIDVRLDVDLALSPGLWSPRVKAAAAAWV